MNSEITTGTPVSFQNEDGPQEGTVIGIKRDIGNMRGYAVVELKHNLSGCLQAVPLNELQVRVQQ